MQRFIGLLQPYSRTIPSNLLSLPAHLSTSSLRRDDLSPIIPLHTRCPRPLSAHLLKLGMNARPITWPTVPKGKDRVRICLHAGNTQDEVEGLVRAVVDWASGVLGERELLAVPVGMSGAVQASKL